MRTAQPSFIALATKPDVDQETAFTICRMIDSVGWDFVEDWDWNWLEGKKKDYRKLIKPEWIEEAWSRLEAKDWYSQQTTNDVDKRISTVAPLAEMVQLQTLVLQNNLVEDLRPLSGMTRLKRLNCHSNRIRDLATLENFPLLEDLSIAENPVDSFAVLERLPALRKLSISASQIRALNKCTSLGQVENLYIDDEGGVEDFSSLPEMRLLRVLTAWNVKDLSGLERFATLVNVRLPGAKAGKLEALRGLKSLTHFSISTPKALNVEPLRELNSLRYLSLNSRKRIHGLSSLGRLPALHQVRMDDETTCHPKELNDLRNGMTSWDVEFKAAKDAKPSLSLDVVDQPTFDHYDSKAPFGLHPGESNEEMLASERSWLLDEIRDGLTVKFKEEQDFHLPYTSGFQRTERVIIYSVEAYEALRDVVGIIQGVLCETRNDWIIWCQSLLGESPEEQKIPEDAEDFIVWIYPNKIMVAEKDAKTVRQLVEWKN